MSKEKIIIFDTTLRDGEQSPGASMNIEEKIQIAKQLEKLGVDVIEAGFAAASEGDFEAIKQIAKVIKKSKICSLARATKSDIEKAAQAIGIGSQNRIHTFIATSPIHMEYKLKMTEDEVIQKAVEAVSYAKTFVDDVEFSLEDAGRTEIPFMKRVIDAVIKAGAKTINLPDTVGYRLPNEIYNMVKEVKDYVGDRAVLSLHNHNDLGLGVANTLAGIEAGARQVECTINGIGERAGNAALEEIVMILKTRTDRFSDIFTSINTKEIMKSSTLLATITGIEPQPNKAIVGKNAFSHESGIHQDGMLKNTTTYEIIRPEDVGIERKDTLVMGKHSGRAAFKSKLESLGIADITSEELNISFGRFKLLTDKKKDIYDEDIIGIITDEKLSKNKLYEVSSLQISACSNGMPSAVLSIKFNDKTITDAAIGNGTVDALFKTIDRITGYNGKLVDYSVKSVSEGKDALAKVTCKVVFEDFGHAVIGHGLNIDTMTASARAYVSALNSYLSLKGIK
jgi:2-isopropylmalate synthase